MKIRWCLVLLSLSCLIPCLNARAQLFSDSFDSGLGQWTASGGWAINADEAATDSVSDNYTNNSDSALTLASPLNFSSATNPALLVTHHYAIEAVYDTATVEVSTNGGSSWVEMALFTGNQLAGKTEQIDLTSFAGEASVLIRFRLQTDSSVVHDGWYIEDVLIDEVPGQAVITNTTAQGFSSVRVEWSAPTGSTIQTYELYRSMTSGAFPEDSVLIGETDSGTLALTDFSIAPKNTFYYRVVSVDSAGLVSVSDESSITLAAGMDFPFLDSGEAGATHWVAGGDWALVAEPGNPANTCWSDSPDGPYTNSINASLTLVAPLDLSSATDPVLAFQHKLDLLTGDILSVEVSTTDGAEWTSLQSFSAHTSTNQWTQENISLSSYIGADPVLIRFLLTTSVSDTADGVWLDNIAVAEAPSSVPSLLIDEVQSHSVRLGWTQNLDTLFSHYAIYRKLGTADVDFHNELVAEVTPQSQTQFTDTGLLLNSDYVYRVYGVSSYGTLSTVTAEQTVLTENNPIPFADDFEGGTNGWVLAGNWNLETDGSNSWLSDSPGSFYNNNHRETDNYALTAVDLSDATWPVLSFRDKFNMAGLIGTDRGYLQISINGSTWYNRYAVTGERAEWADQQIDLSEWAGQPNVRIRFYLYTDGSSTADGWQIDDISVEEHVPDTTQALPLYERFEDGATNWIGGGWVVSTNESYEGTASAESLPIDWTPANVDIYSSFGRELNLSGSTAPQLTLWAKGFDDGRCYLYAQLSNNGGITWTDISGDIIAKPDEWNRFQFAIPTAFKVDGVRLRLRARTYYNDKPTQFFVDKLTIEETPTWVTLGTPVPHLKSIDLSWTEYANDGTFQKYEVYRKESANVTMSDTRVTTSSNRTETTFTDTDLSIGKSYYYKVYVYNLNDVATPSNEGEGTTVPLLLPVDDSLDDLAQWDTFGSWGIETNATESWLSDSPYSPYNNNHRETDNYALTAVDLSGATWPVLSFRDKFNMAGLIGTDRGYLQISINGSTWYNRYAVTGERAEWADQQIDLSEWAGQPNVRIRFYLYTDGSSTADGWQIDDISVEEHVPDTTQALPLYERFEDGATNWIGGGWVVSTNESYEGTASAESLPIDWTPANVDIYSSFGRELNLSGSTAPQLTLWAKGFDDGRCYLYAQLSNNGGITWTDISGDIIAKPDEWNRFQFAIPTAFKVDGVRLRLWARTYHNDKPTQFFVDRLTIGEVTPTAPIPIAPADGSVVNMLYPTLTVENAVDIVDDNASYEFEIYTNATLDPSSLIRRLPTQAAGEGTTSWQVDVVMIDGLQYWWRSRATSSSSHLSEWSTTNTFHCVIVNNPPTDPSILSPYASGNLPDESGLFIWEGSTDQDATDYVVEYQIQIATDSVFSNVLLSAVETNDAFIGVIALNEFSGYESLPLNESYFWRIRAIDSQGLNSGWDTEPFVYGEPAPSAPVPLTPLNDSTVDVQQPTLTVRNGIDPQGDELTYEFEVFIDMELSNRVAYVSSLASGVSNTSWQVDQSLVDDQPYWWHCRVSDGRQYSSWSVVSRLYVNHQNLPPNPVDLFGPTPGGFLHNLHSELSWFPATDPDLNDTITAYHLQIADNSEFTAPIVDDSDIPPPSEIPEGDDWIIALPAEDLAGSDGLVLHTIYFWRMRAVDAAGAWSEWNDEAWLFKYGTPSIEIESSLTAGMMHLQWNLTGAQVQLQFSPSLTVPDWQPVGDPTWGDEMEIAVPPGSTVGFYRLIVVE